MLGLESKYRLENNLEFPNNYCLKRNLGKIINYVKKIFSLEK